MAEAIAGVAFVSLNGARQRLVGEATYQMSGGEREPKNGADGFHGFKEKPRHGEIEFKIRNARDVDLQALSDVTDATVTLELANGKTVVGRNMFRTGEPLKSDAEEAEIMATFAGPDVREI